MGFGRRARYVWTEQDGFVRHNAGLHTQTMKAQGRHCEISIDLLNRDVILCTTVRKKHQMMSRRDPLAWHNQKVKMLNSTFAAAYSHAFGATRRP